MTNFNFKVTKSEKTGFGPIDEGNYECLIDMPSEEATKGGTEYFQVPLTVRNDLDGVLDLEDTNKKYHNRKLFDLKIWKRKETGEYDPQNFSDILTAVGISEGTEISSQEQLINYLAGKPLKAYVKKGTNTYKGETTEVNQIAPWNLEPTEYPNVQHVYKNKDVQPKPNATPQQNNQSNPFDNNSQIDVGADDLPF